MGDASTPLVGQPGGNGTTSRPVPAGPAIAPAPVNNGGGDPTRGTGSPPSFYTPANVTNWAQALTLMGVTIIDSNKDGKVDKVDAEAIFKEKGVDVNDGIDYEEAKKLNPNLKQGSFNVLSQGGHGTGGDGKIELKDLVAFNNDVVNRMAPAFGGRDAVIAKYLAANSFSMIDPDKAAAKFNEQKKNVPELYAADGRIKANVLLDKCINPALRGAVVAVLTNVTGQPVDDNLYLTADQFKLFLLAMNFLGQIDKPEDVLVSANGIPKIGEKEDVLSWLTDKAAAGQIPPEPKPAAARADGSHGDEASGKLSQQDQMDLQLIRANQYPKGNAEAVKRLEEMKAKDPSNIAVRRALAEKYVKINKPYEAVQEALFVYNNDPKDADAQKLLIGIAANYAEKNKGKQLPADQKETAGRLKVIFEALSTDTDSDEQIKKAAEQLAVMYDELLEDPIPGEKAFQEAITAKDSKVQDVKKAYDDYAKGLDDAIKAELQKPNPNKHRLARLYAKLGEVEMNRCNYGKAGSCAKALAALYPELDEKDKKLAKEVLKSIIGKLIQFRHSDQVLIAQGVLKDMRPELIKELDLKVAVQKKNKQKNELDIDTEDITITSASDLDRFIKPPYRPLTSDIAIMILRLSQQRKEGKLVNDRTARMSYILRVVYMCEGENGKKTWIEMWKDKRKGQYDQRYEILQKFVNRE